MTFAAYFIACGYEGSAPTVLPDTHPLAAAVRLAGRLHRPTVALADVQRPDWQTGEIPVLQLPGDVEATSGDKGNGLFEVSCATPPQEPTLVYIAGTTPHLQLTVAHELGHVMDHLLKVHLSGPTHVTTAEELYASEVLRPELEPWWSAVQATDVYQALHRTQGFRDHFDGPPSDSAPLRLDSPAECFACSFAQLIATDTGDATLQAQLHDAQEASSPRYWSAEAFGPIGAALRDLFRTLGW